MEVTGTNNNTVFSYTGAIDLEILSFFGKFIKNIVNGDTKLSTRIYKIFIELAQNISYYSAEKRQGITKGNLSGAGNIELSAYPEGFTLKTGNLVHRSDGFKLIKNCSEINNLSMDELRMLKRVKRRELVKIDNGAHIGLMHIGLLAESKLNYRIDEINDEFSYFNIEIDIKK